MVFCAGTRPDTIVCSRLGVVDPVRSMFDWLASSFRREAGIRTLLAVALMTALLCAGGALPAQATKGGIPALPDAASDHARPDNGVGPGKDVGSAQQTPDAPGDTNAGVESAPANPPGGASPGGGANDLSGPYDPDPANPGASGVGQPSGNGKSTDNNGNRPCAGCVGNADYKNPPGQLPDGSDDNRGYECDENEGIGKMNPAHSGCAPTPPTPPVNSPPSVVPPTPAVTPPTPAVTPPTRAVTPPAESPPPGGEDEQPGGVQGVDEGPELPELPQQPPVVEAIPVRAPIATTSQALNELPFTGGQALLLGLLGFLSLVVGLGLARMLRIRSAA